MSITDDEMGGETCDFDIFLLTGSFWGGLFTIKKLKLLGEGSKLLLGVGVRPSLRPPPRNSSNAISAPIDVGEAGPLNNVLREIRHLVFFLETLMNEQHCL